MNKSYENMAKLGLHPANILIPKKGTDLNKWAIVACDQYTSNRNYWERVKNKVGENYSTLNLIFPEVYLEDGDNEERIQSINQTMESYVNDKLFTTYEHCFFLVKRQTPRSTRWGLVGTLDLEAYDYSPSSTSLIRATEGTILSRIPPRKAIRKNALLELPHIMVLIDDKKRSVIEPLKGKGELVYDFDLMENGGHLSGYQIADPSLLEGISSALTQMYANLDKKNPLLYAMGDGNHSLATAKSLWEDIKKDLSEEEKKNHPSRFALVEIENIHDEGLQFEPIHRVLFSINKTVFESLLGQYTDSFTVEDVACASKIEERINQEGLQKFGYVDGEGNALVYSLDAPQAAIAAGTLQLIIDTMLSTTKSKVDYIHGLEETITLGSQKGNIGIILPNISKETFFEAIIKDKALPRKTFSMGEANEKRYYMEARRLK